MNLYLNNPLILFVLCFSLVLFSIICIYLVNERINRPIVSDINTNTNTDSDTNSDTNSIINAAHV